MRTRPLLLLFILSFANLPGGAQNPKILETLVQDWNHLHNNREVARLRDLYAPSVLFYGRTLTRETCYKRKKAFLKSDFTQEIISPVTITYYSSGTIKCDFRKRTATRGVIKEHDCYLLVEKKEETDFYQITGESELEIDRKLKVTLDLGEIVEGPGSGFGTIYIAGLVIAVLIFLFWLRHRHRQSRENTGYDTLDSPVSPAAPVGEEKQENPSFAPVREPVPAPTSRVIAAPVGQGYEAAQSPVIATQEVSDEISAKEKGDAFERYVVSRFCREYFELLEWRSDKYHEGVYATSSRLPDLEYQFKTSYYNFRIAAECKWRAAFSKGRIEWAKSYQLITYRQYESERGIPVFVIIGIGGEPDGPGEVYVVPLREIRSHVLSEYELKKYYRHKTGNFFLNPEAMVLE
ncbi:MAG: hypothetical protein EOO01_11045 [Chitinophagaceae bacterium]|nr:MAG: hypothetical protein EOO01_11045 [Chitinophagaceae bacterium]